MSTALCEPRIPRGPLWMLVGLGLLWRLWVAWLTPIPSEDGVNYLWMAERFAQGEFAQGLSEVFPPLMPLLIAPAIRLGADPFIAGQVVLAAAGALAVVPIARGAQVLRASAWWPAAILGAFGLALPIKYAAEIYTEPLFILIGGLAFDAGMRGRWWATGTLAAVAFWVRPEAVLIPAAFALCRRGAWVACVPATVSVLVLMVWRGLLGAGWALVGKLPLIWERSVFRAEGLVEGIGHFFVHAAQIPLLYLEAFTLAGVLAVIACVRRRGPDLRPVVLLWVMVVVVVSAFLPRRRFLVGWTFTIVPLAALVLADMPRRWRRVLLVVAVVSGLGLSLRVTAGDREAERALGLWLRQRSVAGDKITSDMTRVLWFAGRRPNPPEHLTVEHLIRAGRTSRFVVLGARRAKTPEVVAGLSDHAQAELPPELAELARRRGILVLERR